MSLIAGIGALSVPGLARAGAQVEEPLADSVRSALSSAIANDAPPVPEFSETASRLKYLRWLGTMSDRLKRRRNIDFQTIEARTEFMRTVWYESTRAALEPALVLGLIQVESGFRKNAFSSAGALGYMQVMPFWMRTIGNGDVGKLIHMQTNLRFGCVILRHYLARENGDLFLALGRYNGSRGKEPYPNAVMGARKQWEF